MYIRLVLLLLFSSFLYAQTLPLIFQGNKNISDRELYTALNLHKPYIYEFYKHEPALDPKTLPIILQTLIDYYKTKGFYHTTAAYFINKENITINIDENLPINIQDITISSPLDISTKLPFKIDDRFDSEKFIQSKKDIKLFYANNHYCNAKLDAKAWIDIETNHAYLTYIITPNELCYFGKITIESSKNIDAEIIESLLYIHENEPFSLESITKSYQNIYAYDGISKALIETKTDSNNVDISVRIVENEKPIRTQIGLGVNSDEGLMLSLGAKHRNLLGNLKTLSLNTKITQIKQTIKTNYEMPLKNKNNFGAELGLENEIFEGFKENRVFGSVYLKQRFLPTSLKESLFFDHVNTYSSDDKTLFPEGVLFVLSPKLEWGYDTRDKLLEPSKGYFLGSEIMGSVKSEISDASYYKLKLWGGYILPISSSILASKISFGSMHLYDGDLPQSYNFFAGGMNSNRAYRYAQLGPKDDMSNPIGFNSILETRVEERFPIYGNIKGVVFNDNTFIGEDSVPNFDNGYYSAGVGLRYVTPIGPIAIDFGFDISNPTAQYAFHFHIGESF